MKNLKKFVALLLAGVMAMVMLTACSGGGNGSNLKEDTTAEAKVLGKYSTSTASVDNNKALKAEAEKFLDEKINASGSIFGYKFVLGGEVKGKDKEYLTVLVATNFSYEDTILGLILNEISKKVNTDTMSISTRMALGQTLALLSREIASIATWQLRSRSRTPTTTNK